LETILDITFRAPARTAVMMINGAGPFMTITSRLEMDLFVSLSPSVEPIITLYTASPTLNYMPKPLIVVITRTLYRELRGTPAQAAAVGMSSAFFIGPGIATAGRPQTLPITRTVAARPCTIMITGAVAAVTVDHQYS
jgi:hypothetical protein